MAMVGSMEHTVVAKMAGEMDVHLGYKMVVLTEMTRVDPMDNATALS
jgi:hypothetical protein